MRAALKINHDNPRIGDTILIEPALTAYGERNNSRISLYVRRECRELFAEHPWIDLRAEPHACPDNVLCPSSAFAQAHAGKLPFGSGYWRQLGMEPSRYDRMHFKCYGLPEQPPMVDRVLIAPFSRACLRHQGRAANVQPDLEWWERIIAACPYPVFTLGASDDPTLPGTTPLKGLPLRQVLLEMQRSRAMISVETAILHLASTTKTPTVFLSSATPEWFAKPDTQVEVIRAKTPAWNIKKVLEALDKIL